MEEEEELEKKFSCMSMKDAVRSTLKKFFPLEHSVMRTPGIIFQTDYSITGLLSEDKFLDLGAEIVNNCRADTLFERFEDLERLKKGNEKNPSDLKSKTPTEQNEKIIQDLLSNILDILDLEDLYDGFPTGNSQKVPEWYRNRIDRAVGNAQARVDRLNFQASMLKKSDELVASLRKSRAFVREEQYYKHNCNRDPEIYQVQEYEETFVLRKDCLKASWSDGLLQIVYKEDLDAYFKMVVRVFKDHRRYCRFGEDSCDFIRMCPFHANIKVDSLKHANFFHFAVACNKYRFLEAALIHYRDYLKEAPRVVIEEYEATFKDLLGDEEYFKHYNSCSPFYLAAERNARECLNVLLKYDKYSEMVLQELHNTIQLDLKQRQHTFKSNFLLPCANSVLSFLCYHNNVDFLKTPGGMVLLNKFASARNHEESLEFAMSEAASTGSIEIANHILSEIGKKAFGLEKPDFNFLHHLYAGGHFDKISQLEIARRRVLDWEIRQDYLGDLPITWCTFLSGPELVEMWPKHSDTTIPLEWKLNFITATISVGHVEFSVNFLKHLMQKAMIQWRMESKSLEELPWSCFPMVYAVSTMNLKLFAILVELYTKYKQANRKEDGTMAFLHWFRFIDDDLVRSVLVAYHLPRLTSGGKYAMLYVFHRLGLIYFDDRIRKIVKKDKIAMEIFNPKQGNSRASVRMMQQVEAVSLQDAYRFVYQKTSLRDCFLPNASQAPNSEPMDTT
ncbi:unnamed protein product [Caenorhabditis auriculariae]|uniref:Uncharacterized protein n=1 Tax=Caenorhabditis auriculariae TaxID=2777116 RepID=A0A8S1HM05_9PELO|nr:unnamed protein product [Caenorhabditis auriculariae]